jgi:sulfate transport system ATP-binding protein
MAEVSFHEVGKVFPDGTTAVRDLTCTVRDGEFMVLVGPSGCGKTTALRMVAGLEQPSSGAIAIGGEVVNGVPPRARDIAMVFQNYALYPHKTVAENLSFGLKMHKVDKEQIDTRVKEVSELLALTELLERKPAQLSGGQRQRVAFARALAIEPRVLLLDEPFGALDAKVRKDLRRWLRELHRKIGYTTVFVTHDQEEALELADRVVIMNRGRIEQVGSTDEVYERPKTPFVFEFLGGANVLQAEVRGREVFLHGAAAPLLKDSIHPNGPADLYVRPGDLRLAEPGMPGLDVKVMTVHRAGPTVHATASLAGNGTTVSIELPHLHHDAPSFKPGATLTLRLMQFSLYPRGSAAAKPAVAGLTPVGEHRERERG